MKFLVDAQLPPALKDWFRIHGYEARHVQDVGLLDAKMGPFGSMPLAGNPFASRRVTAPLALLASVALLTGCGEGPTVRVAMPPAVIWFASLTVPQQ